MRKAESLELDPDHNSPRSLTYIQNLVRFALELPTGELFYITTPPTHYLLDGTWKGEQQRVDRTVTDTHRMRCRRNGYAMSCYSSVLLDSQLRARAFLFSASRRFKRSSESRPRTLAKLLCNWTLSTAQFLLVFLLRALALSLISRASGGF